MYGNMPLVLLNSIPKSETMTQGGTLLSNTHSVGDGTDSIVRLRTICGNLKNYDRW